MTRSLGKRLVHRHEEQGRLILRLDGDLPISMEERRTVVTIADLFAAGPVVHGAEADERR